MTNTSHHQTVHLLRFAPLSEWGFFVRSGGITLPAPKPLINSGQNGDYWSSAPNSSGYGAYYLYFGASGVSPSSGYNRFSGFSLRCLAS